MRRHISWATFLFVNFLASGALMALIVGSLLLMLSGCAVRGADGQPVDKAVGIAWSWPLGAAPPVDSSLDIYKVKVRYLLAVYDGDTFFIRLPECAATVPFLCKRIGVRVAGIDTPEIRGKCAAEKAAALRARSLLAELLTGSGADDFWLVGVRREKYGRLLADVRVGPAGEYAVAGLLIKAGAARPYSGGARLGWCAGEAA